MNNDYTKRFENAVKAFWDTRERQAQKQIAAGVTDAGLRGAVTGGAQMAVLEELICDLLTESGVPQSSIYRRTKLEVPGYYRPEKRWDILVVHNNRLHVALECKSQAGPSFGNNANNRTEEAIGNAECLLTAFRERRLGDTVNRPFFGYIFVLEDCPEVHQSVALQEPHFQVDPAFLAKEKSAGQRRSGVSYAKRYELLIERLLLESKYDAGCLTLAKKGPPPEVAFPNANLSAQNFLARLQGFIAGAVAAGL